MLELQTKIRLDQRDKDANSIKINWRDCNKMMLKDRSSLHVSLPTKLNLLAEPTKKFQDFNDFKPVDFEQIKKRTVSKIEKQKKEFDVSNSSNKESAQPRSENQTSDLFHSLAVKYLPDDLKLISDRLSKHIEEPNENIKEWLVDLIKNKLLKASPVELN